MVVGDSWTPVAGVGQCQDGSARGGRSRMLYAAPWSGDFEESEKCKETKEQMGGEKEMVKRWRKEKGDLLISVVVALFRLLESLVWFLSRAK